MQPNLVSMGPAAAQEWRIAREEENQSEVETAYAADRPISSILIASVNVELPKILSRRLTIQTRSAI